MSQLCHCSKSIFNAHIRAIVHYNFSLQSVKEARKIPIYIQVVMKFLRVAPFFIAQPRYFLPRLLDQAKKGFFLLCCCVYGRAFLYRMDGLMHIQLLFELLENKFFSQKKVVPTLSSLCVMFDFNALGRAFPLNTGICLKEH